jgi:ubiquinone/menaquinone biosynthesis C-methylase UbiE
MPLLMENIGRQTSNIYETEEYVQAASLRFNEQWKTGKITPAIDVFVHEIRKEKIAVLDIGGGTGIILNNISMYLEKSYKMKVTKFSLDVSDALLDVQKKNNPDTKIIKNDVTNTSLFDKQIDLSLMLDVLEHVANPRGALEELRRISKFVVFCVPLEDAPVPKILNYLRRNSTREAATGTVGHVNFYNANKLVQTIQKYCGNILWMRCANMFKHYRESELYDTVSAMARIKIRVAQRMCERSPKLASQLLGDQIIVLVRCY